MKIQWNKVTWYSKSLAMIIFIAAPFVGFCYGMQYGRLTANLNQPSLGTTTVESGYYSDPTKWQTDIDTQGGFSIAYPIDFDTQTDGGFMLTVPKAFEPQSNFADAKFTITVDKSAEGVAQCLTLNQNGGPMTATSTATIDNVPFATFQGSDAGAGNYYDTTSYRIVHGGSCYVITYIVHSTQIANYPASYELKPFDSEKIQTLLRTIVGTFKFL